MGMLALVAAVLAQAVTLEVTAPKGATDAPVSCTVPERFDLSGEWHLVGPDGNPVPMQVVGREVTWIVRDLAAGKKVRYRLMRGEGGDRATVDAREQDGKILLEVGGRKILQYNAATVYPPKKFDQDYARNAFIHPIWTPSGKVISNQWPVHHHLHQNGLWLAWKYSVFEDRQLSFWDTKSRKAMVEYVKTGKLTSGSAWGGFRVTHHWEDRSAPGGKKTALEETWDVRAYAAGDAFVFDLVSTQTCATDKPVVQPKHHYGGFAYRGPADWEEKMDYLTDLGKNRKTGNQTRARWVVALGKIGGQDAQIGFLSHPSNFRAPQPVRLHPKMPYFCFTPNQSGDFAIEPGKPFVSRYRMVVRDGVLSADEMNLRWASYAHPPTARVVE